MHPFLPPENIRKRYGFRMFSVGRENVYWERMGQRSFKIYISVL